MLLSPPHPPHAAPLVYDFGMNNGDDVAYYLAKGCRVIAVEANPALCAAAAKRFDTAIADGLLKIINCAVHDREGSADFFVHDQYDVLSTLVPEQITRTDIDLRWKRISVPARRASAIIAENGPPFFVKTDVEQVDHIVLKDLLKHDIIPPFISSEAQQIEVYCALVCMGYDQFKLVDGDTVPLHFHDHPITRVDGSTIRYDFMHHSSGPFGEDLPGPWLDKSEVLDQLLKVGFGWKDLHARRA